MTLRTIPLALTLCGLLSGCASPETRLYTLTAISPTLTAGAAANGSPIRVVAVHVPPIFDRPEILRDAGDKGIAVDDFELWAAPFGQLVHDALTQDLIERLPPGAVVDIDAPAPAERRDLAIDVLAFRQTPHAASLDLRWALTSTLSATPPQIGTFHLEEPTDTDNAKAETDALSQLLAEASDRMVYEIAHSKQ